MSAEDPRVPVTLTLLQITDDHTEVPGPRLPLLPQGDNEALTTAYQLIRDRRT